MEVRSCPWERAGWARAHLELLFGFGVTALLLGAPAAATTIASAGDSFSVSFTGNVGGVSVPGLTADATFLVQSYVQDATTDTTTIVLDISLTNTADTTIWQSARLSEVGFDTDPTVSSASASGLFDYANLAGAFPNGYGSVDVCAINNQNNCQGGSNGGLFQGQTGTVTMTLNYDSQVASVDITNIGLRWQALDSQQLGIRGGSGTGSGSTPPIPEPTAALAFGIGLLLVGASRGRR